MNDKQVPMMERPHVQGESAHLAGQAMEMLKKALGNRADEYRIVLGLSHGSGDVAVSSNYEHPLEAMRALSTYAAIIAGSLLATNPEQAEQLPPDDGEDAQ